MVDTSQSKLHTVEECLGIDIKIKNLEKWNTFVIQMNGIPVWLALDS